MDNEALKLSFESFGVWCLVFGLRFSNIDSRESWLGKGGSGCLYNRLIFPGCRSTNCYFSTFVEIVT